MKNPLKFLANWYCKKVIIKSLRRKSAKLREFSKFAPIPTEMLGAQNILDRYGSPQVIGTIIMVNTVNGTPCQVTQQIVSELVKVRFPDGVVELTRVAYARDEV